MEWDYQIIEIRSQAANRTFWLAVSLWETWKNGDPLRQLNDVINWEGFRPALSRVREKERKNNAGAKPYDVVMMFEILVIQSLYNLSRALRSFIFIIPIRCVFLADCLQELCCQLGYESLVQPLLVSRWELCDPSLGWSTKSLHAVSFSQPGGATLALKLGPGASNSMKFVHFVGGFARPWLVLQRTRHGRSNEL